VTPKRISVLIVDDRPANRYPAMHALTRAGFQVIEASTGKEALELSKTLPTVIVLDVKLPDILGYEVCRRIKANARTSQIPVLQLSAAFVSDESKLYALESGADAYLIQPADPVVLVATVKSMVRLHQAELRAELVAKQWQATFDALTEGVVILDSAGIVQRCNRAMTELLDMTYGEIENHDLNGLIQQRFGLSQALPDNGPPIEIQSGGRFFRFSLDPIVSDHEARGSIFIVAETTKQKLAEEALLTSERLAATGRMAHTIAHEINNPLEAITNLVYLLQNSLEQPQVAYQYINSVANELARVSRISRQILSFNRESSFPVEIRVSEIIEDVLALNNRSMVDKGLQIKRDWDAALCIQGYPGQLRQVFSNLVRNAVEASFAGGWIRIRISANSFGHRLEEPAVRITVADRGVGIPVENRKRIFDAFFTTKALKGSGVGLWLSSTIVHEHGGCLSMRSRTDPSCSGTCISVLLPTRWKHKSENYQVAT
jgi:two-component system NtrC family sensor kinase